MVNFIWKNSASIVAGDTLRQSWEQYDANAGVYLPFNYTRITNNSLAEITFYPNQDLNQGIVCPAGSSTSIDADIISSLWTFAIKNNDGTQTITANQITILGAKVKVQ